MESGRDEAELQQFDTVANGTALFGRNHVVVDVSWLQWRDGSCNRPATGDGTPFGAGRPAGAACRRSSDCEVSCQPCTTTSASFLVQACVDHVCADASTAANLALERQSSPTFRSRALCR